MIRKASKNVQVILQQSEKEKEMRWDASKLVDWDANRCQCNNWSCVCNLAVMVRGRTVTKVGEGDHNVKRSNVDTASEGNPVEIEAKLALASGTQRHRHWLHFQLFVSVVVREPSVDLK